jgi:hypothetical protein
VDTIVKGINDLTHALKGRKNLKRIAQIEALEKNDEILNNLSKATETNSTTRTIYSTLQNILQQSSTETIIDRSTTTTSTPRVQATNKTPIVNTEPPTPRLQTKSTNELPPQRIKLRSHVCQAITNTEPNYHSATTDNSINMNKENVSNSSMTKTQDNTSTINNSSATQNNQNFG